jgi:hypothetical protein
MTDRRGISNELRPYVDSDEAEAFDRLGYRLEEERPIPAAAFRAALLGRLGAKRMAWRPRHLGTAVAAYLGSGLALLTVAAVGLSGVGPLGY